MSSTELTILVSFALYLYNAKDNSGTPCDCPSQSLSHAIMNFPVYNSESVSLCTTDVDLSEIKPGRCFTLDDVLYKVVQYNNASVLNHVVCKKTSLTLAIEEGDSTTALLSPQVVAEAMVRRARGALR
ncbi:hypothetical protein ACA910_011856 [Epithemia clementina (nom. ined.)]